MDKKMDEIITQVLLDNEELMTELGKGPQGEYVHSLEEKVRFLIQENKNLKGDIAKLKELLRKLK